MKRVAMTAALVAAVAVWGLSLPPRRTTLETTWSDGTVRGLLHVHSRYSDGRGTFDEIAAAASRAGFQFIVVTDHGDGTRKPEPPTYRSGVLLLDGVEISTRGGHYVAVGLPQAPYPLGGAAADVVEDVRRLGGFGIAAHPDSPKAELRWREWQTPFDGVELVNPDTSWRVHAFASDGWSKWLLLRTLLAYPLRPAESIARILTQSAALRDEWLKLAAERPVVAVAGADAHAKLALRDTEPGDNRFSVPIPSYESSFDSLSVHVRPARPFDGNATLDAAALLAGLRAGQVYVAVDGWATPPAFTLSGSAGGAMVEQGGTLAAGVPVTLHVRSNAPPEFTTIVWRSRERVTERPDREFDLQVGSEPGVYTVEIRKPETSGMPAWVTSNPVYVRSASRRDEPHADGTLPAGGRALFDGRSTRGWSQESDPTSLAVVDVAPLLSGMRVRLRYGLSGGAAVGQYAAAAVETADGVAAAGGVAFSIRSEAPMRLSVQVRAEVAGAAPERWERSVYVDTTERQQFVRFRDMTPVGLTHQELPPQASIRAIMFVVDTTNTSPGSSGRVWLGDVRLVSD